MTTREEVESAHARAVAALKQLLADVLYGGVRSARDGVWDRADEAFCEFKAACARHETAQRVARAEHVRESEWRTETRAALRRALRGLERAGDLTREEEAETLARIRLLLEKDAN